eukprot:CAMPEP_0113484256 /NCGR_PEP_ID=MMETSP0014_2-20120614/23866_1 /TAXON_ID=2857 /ORGANISM="Nitzschia sp." /LENGTH=99 /DNA_ID=CAMNT_0000377849 /DNA_START=35 /DNA_END=334 /DNA_ORIENTATION=- /assembly_acc=CAM_ASM_000159
MADSNKADDTPPPPPPPPPAPPADSSSASSSSWKLPTGIEDDIEQALIKTVVGASVGGVVGMIMFRGGGGMRAASVATGVGVAAGSTYERLMEKYYYNK